MIVCFVAVNRILSLIQQSVAFSNVLSTLPSPFYEHASIDSASVNSFFQKQKADIHDRKSIHGELNLSTEYLA